MYVVFEQILKRVILSTLSECNAITGCQHLFLPRKSCLSNLMILEETITPLMDDWHTVDVLYVHFAMAFASVIHRFLVAKFESFGLCQKVVRWIRTYRVYVTDVLSQEIRIKSGASHGSVIGSLLFVLFVNELPRVINVITRLFAGDVKIASPRVLSGHLQSSLYNV